MHISGRKENLSRRRYISVGHPKKLQSAERAWFYNNDVSRVHGNYRAKLCRSAIVML